ncbi:MAG: amidohydrolase family protein [Streptosporangiales bacterium]|nr:amidohydrolase family protein [Streptosporangiales bacterium]
MGMSDPRAADLVLLNGRLLTMGGHPGEAQALAVQNGRIIAVGSDQEIERLVGGTTEVVELGGRYAMPGLADCHVHLASDAARSADSVECRDFYDPSIRTVEHLLDRLREQASNVAPGSWVIGRGSPLQDFRLRDGRLPTCAELDRAAPDHPAYIYFGAHLLVANTRAMSEQGIDRDTPSPQGGTVVKDAEGNPTGVFRERAQFLIKPRGTPIGPEELAERIAIELDKCSRRGVTTIHDIVTDRNEILAYQLLARDGCLRVRVHLVIRVIESNFTKWSLEDLGLIHGFGGEWLQIGGIKMSIDGGFTGKNAAFSEPLDNDEGHEHPGLVRIKQDELDETVERYHRAGMRICTHAIGDVALDMILQSYEKAQAAYPRLDHRHRVEHMGNWMMTPERVERARRINLLPIPNPPFPLLHG